jgi:hypothetical protein
MPQCTMLLGCSGTLPLFHSSRSRCSSLRSIEISEFSSYLFSVALAVIGHHTMSFTCKLWMDEWRGLIR